MTDYKKQINRQFKILLTLFIMAIFNFVAFKSFSQGILESTSSAVQDASSHLANDYGLSGIFIVFLIILVIAMGTTIHKLIVAFITSNSKFIETETKQTELMKDMKGMMIKIIDRMK